MTTAFGHSMLYMIMTLQAAITVRLRKERCSLICQSWLLIYRLVDAVCQALTLLSDNDGLPSESKTLDFLLGREPREPVRLLPDMEQLLQTTSCSGLIRTALVRVESETP